MTIFNEAATLDYELNRTLMQKALDAAIALSRQCAGYRANNWGTFYGSLLFTSLCTRSFTFLRICPETTSEKREGFWDFSSVATIARSILEVRLTFFYLTEACSEDERRCRLDVMNTHDCMSRIRLFTTMDEMGGDGRAQIETFESQLKEIRIRLGSNAHFMSLPKGQRTNHLNGSKSFLYPLENIGSRCGIKEADFRLFYQLWSTQAHGFPMAFYRMAENGRGRGVHSDQEEQYTSMCLSLCYQLLGDTTEEMRGLFSPLIRGTQIMPPSALITSLLGKI